MKTNWQKVLLGGMAAGGIGYVTIIVVSAGFNVLAGRSPFYTAAAFGSVLFYGLRNAANLEIAPGPILAYNALHALVFLVMGIGTAWLLEKAEQYPVFQYVVLFALVFVGFHAFAALLLFAQPLLGTSASWQIGGAGLLAAILMGGYFWRTHPVLRREMKEIQWGDVPEP